MEHQSPESPPPITTRSFGVGNERGKLAIDVQGQSGRIRYDRTLTCKEVPQRDPNEPLLFWHSVEDVLEQLGSEDLELAKHFFSKLSGDLPHNGETSKENTSVGISDEQVVSVEEGKEGIRIIPGSQRSFVEFQANTNESVREAARRAVVELVVRGKVSREQKIVSQATNLIVEKLMMQEND